MGLDQAYRSHGIHRGVPTAGTRKNSIVQGLDSELNGGDVIFPETSEDLVRDAIRPGGETNILDMT